MDTNHFLRRHSPQAALRPSTNLHNVFLFIFLLLSTSTSTLDIFDFFSLTNFPSFQQGQAMTSYCCFILSSHCHLEFLALSLPLPCISFREVCSSDPEFCRPALMSECYKIWIIGESQFSVMVVSGKLPWLCRCVCPLHYQYVESDRAVVYAELLCW